MAAALLLVSGGGLFLYVNEDFRSTTLVMFETVLNEDGEEERRVKVERPEPTPAQIREISENRERHHREKIERQVKRVRDRIEEMRELSSELEDQIAALNVWHRLALLSEKLDTRAERFLTPLPQGRYILEDLPDTLERLERILGMSTGIRGEALRFADASPGPSEISGHLEASEHLLSAFNDLHRKLLRLRVGVGVRDSIWWYGEEIESLVLLRSDTEKYVALVREVAAEGEPGAGVKLEAPEVEATEHPEALSSTLETSLPLPGDEALAAMDVPELYEALRGLAAVADETFTHSRAAELARRETIPLDEAFALTAQNDIPLGADLSAQLADTSPQTLDAYQDYAASLAEASRQAAGIARAVDQRRDQLLPGGREQQAGAQMQEAMALARTHAQLQERAANIGRRHGNLQDLRSHMQAAYEARGGGAAGTATDRTAASAFQTDLNVGDPTVGESLPAQLRIDTRQAVREAVPGRRLDPRATRQGWIFLDTWYIIGPWERPRIRSFDTKFPPEFSIDLDATYQGKAHPEHRRPLELEWRFVQTENIRINPPDEMGDAVYYAYTEVFAAEGMDVVVAVASDDVAKMWVNDLVVWEDSGLSMWQLDEGFRHIRLQPGYNQVLVRVENGPGLCYFSVLFCPLEVVLKP